MGDVAQDASVLTVALAPLPQTSDFCYQCHKQLQGKPVQCKEKCGLEHYCGTACRDKAWDEQHMIFCTKKNAKPSSPYNRLTVRCCVGVCEFSCHAQSMSGVTQFPMFAVRLVAPIAAHELCMSFRASASTYRL
jgi:hypothetical protein